MRPSSTSSGRARPAWTWVTPSSGANAWACRKAIDQALAEALQRMVGYRNIAVHDYQILQLPITIAVIERHLGDFLAFSRAVLTRQAD
jgi:uncharacterized protein YutE (UPF0331/DUF86 family)